MLRDLVKTSLRLISDLFVTPGCRSVQSKSRPTEPRIGFEQGKSESPPQFASETINSGILTLSTDSQTSHEIANVLETFASYSKSFTFWELTELLDSDVDQDEVRQNLINDPRFIRLGLPGGYDDSWIPKGTLFVW